MNYIYNIYNALPQKIIETKDKKRRNNRGKKKKTIWENEKTRLGKLHRNRVYMQPQPQQQQQPNFKEALGLGIGLGAGEAIGNEVVYGVVGAVADDFE